MTNLARIHPDALNCSLSTVVEGRHQGEKKGGYRESSTKADMLRQCTLTVEYSITLHTFETGYLVALAGLEWRIMRRPTVPESFLLADCGDDHLGVPSLSTV